MIKLKDVSKIYYNNGVVGTGFSNVSAEFKIGEFVVIVGESGSGKSTLLNVISGLDTYEEGEMYINGEETSHYVEQDFEEYRRKYVANIFQSFNLVNSYTVRQNVELVLLINGHDKKDMKNRVDEILKSVGLWEYRNKKVTKLSGGQKQKVAIARALAKETPIIIADEPTGNLDSKSAKQIFELLYKMSKDKLVVVVTHNLEQVEQYATRIIKMHDGHIIEDKKIKKVEEISPKMASHNEMSFSAKFFLALRNTFNIIPRFLIILGVFLGVSITILGEFVGVNSGNYEDAIMGVSSIFTDLSPERIIVNKVSRESLSEDDLTSLEKMEHIEKMVKKDFMYDLTMAMDFDEYGSYDGTIDVIDNFEGKISNGDKPITDDEILVVLNEDSIDLLFSEEWFDKKGFIRLRSDQDYEVPGRITAIAIDNDLEVDENKYYVSKNMYEIIQSYYALEKSIKELNYTFENVSSSINLDNIFLDNSVKRGELVLNKGKIGECDTNCAIKDVKMNLTTFYEGTSKDLIVTFNDNDPNQYYGFDAKMNPKDVYEMLPTKDYQVSLYADNYENVDDIVKELKSKGYNAIAVKDTNPMPDAVVHLYKFLNYIGIVFVIVALFIVSHFVVSLVLKSKTTYYAVVRILGGNVKLNKSLINIELFNSMNIAFIITVVLCLLSYYNVINISVIGDSIKFLKPINFVVLYITMVLFSRLLAYKYSKKIFKDSMITTYNGEI